MKGDIKMKNILKIFLLVLSLVTLLSVAVLPAFAAEASAEPQSDIAIGTYIDEEDNMIIVFADGKEYNITDGEWSNASEEEGMGIKFNPDNMVSSLKYMWQGMLCIFVVIGVIILSVYLMSFCSARAELFKQAKNEESE